MSRDQRRNPDPRRRGVHRQKPACLPRWRPRSTRCPHQRVKRLRHERALPRGAELDHVGKHAVAEQMVRHWRRSLMFEVEGATRGEHRWNSPPGFGATPLLAVPAPAPSVRCGRECSRSLCSRALGAKRRRRRVRGEIFPAWGPDRLLCRARPPANRKA